MIYPIEVILIIFVGLSVVDMAERHRLGKSYRELRNMKNLTRLERQYVEDNKHFFRPEPWHWTALAFGVMGILNRLI
jgi:hypothetical protein